MQELPSTVLQPFLEAFAGAPGAFVLDLGCGTGRHAQTLRGAGFRVCAVDGDEDALSTARSLYPDEAPGPGRVDYCAGRLERLPFADAIFEAAVCIDVLHWMADAAAFEAAWNEALRVLRPGGLFFVRARTGESAPFPKTSRETWHRPDVAMLEKRVVESGACWVHPPEPDGDSRVFLLRKA